ncbi:MAG: SDR family oxidoreductase [Hyphomicrobiaceae bacterium]
MKYDSIFNDKYFQGKRFLVTGGSSGIGRCIAHELCALNADVTITGRNEEKLERVTSELREGGGQADYHIMDIRDEGRVVDVIGQILETNRTLDGLVNCAGGQFTALLEELSSNAFGAVVRNNLFGTFHVMREVFKQTMKANGGAIVTISMDSVGGAPLMGHSGAARAGMDNMTKTAAVEWARYGVRTNNVAVGYVESSGLDHYDDPRMHDAITKIPQRTPIGRMGTEAEVSALVCFLLSPAAAYITGQVLQADGGFSLNKDSHMLSLETPERYEIFHGFRELEHTDTYALSWQKRDA